MDQAFSEFLGWHTLIFGLACWILTFFTRRIVETAKPDLAMQADENHPTPSYKTKLARWWNQVILYAIPVFWGMTTAGLAKMYPFPKGIDTLSGRLFFGMVVGFFSGFMFKLVRRFVGRKFDIDLDDEDDPPVAGGEEHHHHEQPPPPAAA